MLRLAIAVLLICICAATSAREVRKLSAGDGGSCPDMVAAKAQAEEKAPATRPREANVAAAPDPRKPATVRGSDQPRLHTPRWHSFLPGMFR